MLIKSLIFLVAFLGAGNCAYNDSLARNFLWPLNVDAYYHGVESCINVTLGTEYEVTLFRGIIGVLNVRISVWCSSHGPMR